MFHFNDRKTNKYDYNFSKKKHYFESRKLQYISAD